MNNRFLSRLAAGLLLGAAPLATAGIPPIPVRGIATVGEAMVILDVFADTEGLPLRSFGIQVKFDPDQLTLTSGGRYEGLWFLRGENGVSYPYTDITLPDPGLARVVGGRLDGDHPDDGVAGDNLLLATLVFKRLTGDPPKFEIGLASPPPYVNFAIASGESADQAIEIQEVLVQAASEDSDKDGLPDDYEIATYGDLDTSDGTTDTDGDGDDDLSEWLRGTDPKDPNSRFVVQIIPQGDGSKLVVWTGALGRVYDLEWSRDLQSFGLIAVGIPGLAPLLDRLDDIHNADLKGFYRVKVKFPTLGR
jgi:hypothetical protein